MSSSTSPLASGSQFGKYSTVRFLGNGAMGSVHLVRHDALDSYFALKVLDPSIAAKEKEFVSRFMREAKLCCQIRHTNLITVHDAGCDEATGLYYLVMDYAAGGTLREKMKSAGGKMPIDEACRIVREVASALEEAERYGMVHRDIKPENIMFDDKGNVKLCDLGLAKVSGGDSLKTSADVVFGTPAYMSPEQAYDSAKVDSRADLYSLGVVFFEMLTGRRPFEGDTAINIMAKVIASDPIPDIRTLRPETPKGIVELVEKMCEKKATRRISSASQVVASLESCGFGKTEGTRKMRGRGILVAAIIGGIAVLGGIAALQVHLQRQKALQEVAEQEAIRKAEEKRLAEAQAEMERERVKLAEEKRLAAERKAAEEKAAREFEERRQALEKKRQAEEQAKREREALEKRQAEEKQRQEAKRLAKERAELEAEAKRIAEEKKRAQELEEIRQKKEAEEAKRRKEAEEAQKRQLVREQEEVARKKTEEKRRREAEEEKARKAQQEEVRRMTVQTNTYTYSVSFSCKTPEEVAALKEALSKEHVNFDLEGIVENSSGGGLFGSAEYRLTGKMSVRTTEKRAPDGLKILQRHLKEHYKAEENVDWTQISRIGCYQDIL